MRLGVPAGTTEMTDTVRLLDRHPEVLIGSELHKTALRMRGGDYGTLAVQGSDGSLVSIDCRILYRDAVAAVKASSHGVFVTTTFARDPRRRHAPNVMPPSSEAELADRFDLVQRHLEALGLRINLREAKLSRVDVFKDVVLDRPYGDYLPGLEACDLQRLSPADLANITPFGAESARRSKRPLGEHTYGRLFQEHAVVVYSKSAHVAGNRRHREYASKVGHALDGRAVARFEGRFLKARTVRKKLGVETGADLISSWDQVARTFSGLVEDTLSLPDQAGAALASAPMTRLDALAESGYGRGKKAVWADLAITMAEIAQRHGPLDIEGLRAKYAASGMRKGDIDEVMACLLAHLPAGESGTAWDALGDIREKLSREAFVWPSPTEGEAR